MDCPEGLIWDPNGYRCYYPRPPKGFTRPIGLCPKYTYWEPRTHACKKMYRTDGYPVRTDRNQRRPWGLRYFEPESEPEMSNDGCPICYEKMSFWDSRKLPCKHKFHKSCIKEWGESSRTCPMCRKSFFGKDKAKRSKRRFSKAKARAKRSKRYSRTKKPKGSRKRTKTVQGITVVYWPSTRKDKNG